MNNTRVQNKKMKKPSECRKMFFGRKTRTTREGYKHDKGNEFVQSIAGEDSAGRIRNAGKKHEAEKGAKGFTCWEQFVGMLFSQFARADSLREIGNGTTIDSKIPVDVMGLTSGVISISAGAGACAITETGGVKCWGSNAQGGVGDGTIGYKSIPVDVTGLTSGVVSISSRGDYACAVTTSGSVKCWGSNEYGQLGDGTSIDKHIPVSVSGPANDMVSVKTNGFHTCALSSTGGVKCWGYNAHGQIGDGSTTTRKTPVDVVGLTSNVVSLDVGFVHTCAVTSTGLIKCWGNNDLYRLGDGTSTNSTTPVDVIGFN